MDCPRCGTENPPAAKFCFECATPLAPAAPAGAVREERKVVSVLFADLVGFTSQAERLDPEEVRAILAPYHAAVRADLERWGGTVEKFIGDAVMALFGAPVAREDDAERAIRAALQVRDTVASDGRLHLRIGIATGEALVALEARPETGEGMAAGDVVNTAARLQSAAPVDGILVDDATFRATTRTIEYLDHEPVTLKGKADPVAVHAAVRARARFGVDVRQVGQVPLVGRARELQLLIGALERARTYREPQLVTLVGVPGIGKSRLVWELFRHVDSGSELVAWRQGRSLPYSDAISFWAVSEIVKAETGILETDTAAEAEAKLARTVDGLGLAPADGEWIGRQLRPLLGLEGGSEIRGDHRGDAFIGWRRFLEALAEQRPMVVVFEDLHWADDGVLDFVDHLVEWATGVPLLIVGTSRPELLTRRPGWGGGKPNAVTISLAPLTDGESSQLVASLVERAVIPDRVRATVLERAQGNPLYAEEFARMVAEGGRLDDLPDTVHGIIAARLDGLSREEKDVLQDAAVVGKVFWSGTVAGMVGRERADVEQVLHGLERKEFVRRERRSSVEGETEYAFRHILVRDVAYGQIPRAERSARHARAAAWIEALGRPADHAELLAQHYLAAIDLARAAGRPIETYAERARTVLRDAGDRAFALNAFVQAARYYRAALDLTAADDADRPQGLFRLGRALRIGQETGAEVLAEAEAGLRAAGDLETAAEAAVLQAELSWFAGDGASTTAHLGRAAELVERLPPSYSTAYVLSDLARYHMLAGRSAEAIEVGRRALAIADELGLQEIRAHALNNIGTARVSAGDPSGGAADLEQALEVAMAANSPEAARVMNNLGTVLSTIGQTARARQLWRDGLRVARERGNAPVARFLRGSIAFAAFQEGDWDEALAVLDDLIAEAESGAAPGQQSFSRAGRARLKLARGDLTGALQDAEVGLQAARRAGDPQDLLPTLSIVAMLMVELGRHGEADRVLDEIIEILRRTPEEVYVDMALSLVAHGRHADLVAAVEAMSPTRWRDVFRLIADERFAEAAAICDELDARPTSALVRLRAAEKSMAAGRADAARAELEPAVAFWRSVGATRWLERAAAVTSRLDEATAQATVSALPRESA